MVTAQQRRVKGGRPHRIELRVSDEERAQIWEGARAKNLSVAAFMVGAAVGHLPGDVSRAAVLTELMALRRQLVMAVGGWVAPTDEQLAKVNELIGKLDAVGKR